MTLENKPVKLTINSNADILSQLKEFEQSSSARLNHAFSKGTNVRELVLERSKHIDCLLISLWIFLELSNNHSLVAVGGYGRGELHPFSDIDLLILTDKNIDQCETEKLSLFITFLWDVRLIVGQSVRTVKQCVSLAKQDITVATNLMESRLLCGNNEYLEQVKEQTSPNKMWHAKDFFDAKITEQKERYKRFKGSSFDLEPNLKSSPGGLRDIQLIVWLAQRCYYPQTLFELSKKTIITKKEYYTLAKCQLFIWKVRYALHLTTGKAEDRLLFDYQKDTAELMGFADTDDSLAVEKMMQKYYRCVLIIRNIGEILIQSLEDGLTQNSKPKNIKIINSHFQIINDRIDVFDTKLFSKEPSNLLKIFTLVAENENIKGITAPTLRAIRASRNKITKKFTQEPINQNLFLNFWRVKHSNSRAMFLMKKTGILANYLPAFRQISGQMQYDMFHSYTVDEHTLFLLKNLIEFNSINSATEFPLCHEIMTKQTKPELIYLAGLFHDLGKGKGGDHSEIGSIEALDFCQQHQINKEDSETISWLVANHLLMSITAQRRDTSDPQVIKGFGDLVKTPHRLELLYILTVADIRATSNTLWNSWKDSLLKKLAITTLSYLGNQEDRHLEAWQDTQQVALKMLMEKGYQETQIKSYWQFMSSAYFSKNPAKTIAWHSDCIIKQNNACNITTQEKSNPTVIAIRERLDGGGNEIFVYSKDKAYLFAILTATIAQHGQNIQGSTIYTDSNDYCYDSFFTLDDTGNTTIQKITKQRLKNAIKQNLMNNQSQIAIQKRMPRQIKHFNVNTEMVFSNDEFSQYTRLDIIARDRPGLLSLFAQAFKECNVRLHDARITTLGEKVEDSFIISHQDNTPINDEVIRTEIKKTIKHYLS